MKMLKFLIYLGVLWRAQCVFFDLTDIDDPASFFFTNRVTTEARGTCTVRNNDGTEIHGKCTHAAKCYFSRGTPRGSCGFGSSCCIYGSGCNTETREKVSYFRGSYKGNTNSFQNSLCSYKIHLMPNTCQLRLDFESFLFNPPDSVQTTSATTLSYRCSRDSLTINPNHYNIPPLCGDNTNQHMYVHLNRTIDSTVAIQIFLGDRSVVSATGASTYVVAKPEWDIKITQLQCKTNFDVFHPNKNSIDEDLQMLAPLGVLQYFTETSGTFRTLGTRDISVSTTRLMTQDPFTYINNLRYAIAFKRYPNVCGVRFTPQYFTLKETNTAVGICVDFLFVPEAQTTDTANLITDSKWCRNPTFPTTVPTISTQPPGPLYIYFSSAATYTTPRANTWAFKVSYSLETCVASNNK